MRKLSLKKGFTLIELLVVVALIGVLASVVLATLSYAGKRGGDAAVKSNLGNLRLQAELLYDTWGRYAVDGTPTYFTLGQCNNAADTMFSDPTIWENITSAYKAGVGITGTRCVSHQSGWAVAVSLRTGGIDGDLIPDSWCVDASGARKAKAWDAGQSILDTISWIFCS